MANVSQALAQALAGDDRFLALALVDLNQDRLLFLQTHPAAPVELAPALHDFLLRLVTDTEGLEQLRDGDETLFYDPDGRQVVSHYRLQTHTRQALVAVVAPDKTYKQALKRLAKLLDPPERPVKRRRGRRA